MTDLFPLESLDVIRERRAGRVPVRRGEHDGHRLAHGGIGDLQRQVREQIERGPVGPVEVVDDDEEWAAFREPDRGRGDGDKGARLLLFLGASPACLRALRVVAEQPLDDGRVPAE